MKRDTYAELFIFCFCCIGCCVLALHFSWRALSSSSMCWSYPNMTASLLYKDTSLFQSSGISICSKEEFLTFLRMLNQNVKRSQGLNWVLIDRTPLNVALSHTQFFSLHLLHSIQAKRRESLQVFLLFFFSLFHRQPIAVSTLYIYICLIRNSEANPNM